MFSKNTRTNILKLSLLIVCLVLGLIIFRNNGAAFHQTTDSIQNVDTIDDIVDYFLNKGVHNYDLDIVAKWGSLESQKFLKEQQQIKSVQVNFIQGCIAAHNDEYDEAIKYFKQAIRTFSAGDDLRIKARSYYELSRICICQEKYEDALQYGNAITLLYQNEKDKKYYIKLNLWRCYDVEEIPDGINIRVKIAEETYKVAKNIDYDNMEDVLFQLALAYEDQGSKAKAMNYKLEVLSIAQNNNDVDLLIDIMTDIGIEYIDVDNYEKALEYFNKAYEYKIEDSEIDAEKKSYIIDNMVIVYIEKKDYAKAEKYLALEEEMIQKEKPGQLKEDDLTNCMLTKALLKLDEGNVNEVFKILKEVKQRYTGNDYFNYVNFDLALKTVYGKAYYACGQYYEALACFKEVEKESNERGISYQEEYAENLYKTYKALGQNQEAFNYIEMISENKKQDYVAQENEQVSFMLEKYESEQKSQTISELEMVNKKIKMMFKPMIVAVFLVIITAMMILERNYRIKKLNALFKKLSETDGLTKVPNRRALDEFLKVRWETMLKEDKPIAIAMVDIDFFKQYNDHYGHQAGDQVLECVAKTLKQHCRKTDFVGRYGGEEFLLILPSTKQEDAGRTLDRLRNEIEKLKIEHAYSKASPYLTVSIGFSTTTLEKKQDYIKIIKEADEALYDAKKKRNNVMVYKDFRS